MTLAPDEQMLKPHALPAHLSYSQANSYNECGERFRLERIFRVPQPPSWALVGGGALHTGTELLDLAKAGQHFLDDHLTRHLHVRVVGLSVEQGTNPAPQSEADASAQWVAEQIRNAVMEVSRWWENTPEPIDGGNDSEPPPVPLEITALADLLLEDAIRKEIRSADANFSDPKGWKASGKVSKAWPDREDRSWWRHHLPLFLHRWITWRDGASYSMAMLDDQTPAIEVDVSGFLGDVEMKSYLDRVMLDPALTPDVVDLKTSTREPVSSEQLGLYAVMLERMGFPKPGRGHFWMARTGELGVAHDLTRYTYDYFAYKYEDVRRRRDAGIFIPNPASPFCGSCPVREYCWATGGAKASLVPRPWTKNNVTIKTKEGAR